jgi:hypothetical protein
MTDFLVSISGWLGEFLLNFFDFVFFLAFLLCLFICLGHAFGYSILSGKAQRSLGLVFLCVLASIILFPTVVFYYMMDIKQGYSLSQTYSMILDANEVTKATFFSIAISAALPALLIGYWMNPSLDLPDIKKIAEEKASGLLERWKERTLYDQERKTSELEQRSQQIKAEEKSLKEFEIKLREYSRELSEQHTELDSEKAKAQNMIAQAEAAIKESEIRVEELSKSNLQLKNQIQRLIPKSRQYSEMKNFVLTHMSKEEDRQTFLQWDKKCLEDVSEEIRKNRKRKKAWQEIKIQNSPED